MLTALQIAMAFVQAINAHDPAALSTLMSADHRFTDAHGNVMTRAMMDQGWGQYFAAFPDYKLDIRQTLVDGDTVVLIGEASASYQGKTDHAWKIPVAIRARIIGTQVAEWQVFADTKLPFESISSGK